MRKSDINNHEKEGFNFLNPSFLLTKKIQNNTSGKVYKYQIKHSKHSYMRSSQRAISKAAILAVLDYGTLFFRQGMIFYAVKEKDLPDNLDLDIRRKAKNLVIVMGHNESQIVTCYWSSEPHKNLKRKSKTLL